MWKRLILRIFSCFSGSLPWCDRSWWPSGTPMNGVAPVAPLVGEHERADARQVGLERQHQQVAHQADVLAVVLGNAAGLESGWSVGRAVVLLGAVRSALPSRGRPSGTRRACGGRPRRAGGRACRRRHAVHADDREPEGQAAEDGEQRGAGADEPEGDVGVEVLRERAEGEDGQGRVDLVHGAADEVGGGGFLSRAGATRTSRGRTRCSG